MPGEVRFPQIVIDRDYFVPGTCFASGGQRHDAAAHEPRKPNLPPEAYLSAKPARGRNAAWRGRYLSKALEQIPRLLSAIDRNPFHPTYGCLDRQFWHYRTASFPSEMYQEGALPLALVYAMPLPGNRWHQNARIKELAVAAMHFAANSAHSDGSCDDYYPFERALGAAVFSLAAATRAYQLLDLNDSRLVEWFARRARWLAAHDESGRLANHHALAALGLLRVAVITGDQSFGRAADERIDKVLDWQSDEGWFEEYGGADPGYQTVTIDCLAKIRQATGDGRLDEPLRRAVQFALLFLHPDGSYGGPYGSRGSCHFYPHGMELLAHHDANAAALADGFLAGLASGTVTRFDDDRMLAHRLGNFIEAYLDWSPNVAGTLRVPSASCGELDPKEADGTRSVPATICPGTDYCHLPEAGMLIRRTGREQTIVSTARGGSFIHFRGGRPEDPACDAGLIVETSDGRLAVSHCHDRTREAALSGRQETGLSLTVAGPLHWTRFETATPIKQAVFHAGMCTLGRWCRTAVRRLLQRRLITGRSECPIRLTRLFEFLQPKAGQSRLRVTDTIELSRPEIRVRRMAIGGDHESAYVAAGHFYQPSTFTAWTDLTPHVDALNARRKVTIVRQF